MNIYFSDEEGRISSEIEALMHKASDYCIGSEIELEGYDIDSESLPLSLSVTVVNREEIRDLNLEYRGIDKSTDVLSFPQFESIEEILDVLESYKNISSAPMSEELEDANAPEILVGDVVICFDVAEEQAKEYETGITREMIYLFVHSIFHLLGYDHEEEGERTEMRTREEEVMEMIGVSR